MAKNTPERRAARAARRAEALKAKQAAERRRKLISIGSVVAVVAVVIGVGFLLANMGGRSEPAKVVPTVAADPDAGGPEAGTAGEMDGFGVVVGDPAAPTTVTIYEDLQCPACANLETQLGSQINAAVDAGKIRVDYRMVSFLDRASSNDYSSRAMNALLVVLDKSGVDPFRALHDELYANQPTEGGDGPDDDELIEAAVDAGADEDAVRGPIEDKVFDQWIKNATDQMPDDGVESTPTIRIDGEDATAAELTALLQQ